MRIAICVITAALLAPISVAAAQQSPASPVISTTGQGEATVVPDRATIYIGVQTHATTAAAAASDNARRTKAVLDTLRASGLTSAELATVNYNVSPEMQYTNGQAPRVTGYTVTNQVRAKVPRIAQLGGLIDAALAKGANEISRLEMESSQADSARRSAISEAVAAARLDAEAMAQAAGGRLGPLLDLSSFGAQPRVMGGTVMMSLDRVAAPTPVESGEQTVTATVSARWSFVPNP